MVKTTHPEVSAGLLRVWVGIVVVPVVVNPVMALGEEADQENEVAATEAVRGMDNEGIFSQTVWTSGLLVMRGVGLIVMV